MTDVDVPPPMRAPGPRIMLVGSFPPPLGGTTVSLEQLRRHLDQHAVECVVVDTNPRGQGMLRAAWRALAAMVARLPTVDVVSLHFSDRAAVTAAPLFWLVCRLGGKPVVYRQFGGEFDRTYAGLPAWRRWLLRRTLLRSEAVLLQTKSMLDALAPLGARLHWFPTARRSTGAVWTGAYAAGARRTLRCAYIGHVRRAKGVLTAATAVAGLADVELDVFGPLIDVDPTEFAHDRVHYRGVLDAQDVPATMAGYDLLLFPTTYPGEGYPGTLVEAALVGLPIVASRWQSLPEMFPDGEVEFVQPGQVDDLAAAIRRFAEQPGLLAARSAALRKRARSTFDAERVFDRFVAICASTLPVRAAARQGMGN